MGFSRHNFKVITVTPSLCAKVFCVLPWSVGGTMNMLGNHSCVFSFCYVAKGKDFCRCNYGDKRVDFEIIKGEIILVGLIYSDGSPLNMVKYSNEKRFCSF